MKLSLSTAKINLRKWFTLGAMLLVVSTCSVVFAQEDQDNDTDPASVDLPASTGSSTSGSTVGSGPWGGTTTTATRPSSSNGNTNGGAAARPAGGATTLDLPDPINPDVPFDSNMNLAFLVIGLVFAFVVYRKKFAVRREPLTK